MGSPLARKKNKNIWPKLGDPMFYVCNKNPRQIAFVDDGSRYGILVKCPMCELIAGQSTAPNKNEYGDELA